jgi:hypothetical protein
MNTTTTVPPSPPIPTLEPGDHLTAPEFERRYDAMPDLKKAELINGVVYMPSPVRWRRHARPHSALMNWLTNYEGGTPGVEAGDNGSVRLDLDNMPQPDGMLIISPECGGQANFGEDDYLESGPELVGEISTSTVSIDLGVKMQMYRRHKVKEYIVWRVKDKALDWFVLRDAKFEPLRPDAQGILRSETFPGLWLNPAALMAFDYNTVMELLQQGFASPEHAAFVTRLQREKAARSR